MKNFVLKLSGIVLGDEKKSLVYSRLVKRLRLLKLSGFDEYCELLLHDSQDEILYMLNAITTNVTNFFRERHHFDFLKKEGFVHLGNQYIGEPLRIWSAGCSTGEEPYSIAITAKETWGNSLQTKIKILATDLSTDVLDVARKGIYKIDKSSEIDEHYCKKYFSKGRDEQGNLMKISQSLQDVITFNQLNLTEKWPMKKKFHIIFCRNVIIYFNKEFKESILNEFADKLVDGGYLFLGHSENIFGVTERFKVLGKTIFQKEK